MLTAPTTETTTTTNPQMTTAETKTMAAKPATTGASDDDNEIKCFVGNLPFAAKESDIKDFFAACGVV